MARITYTYKSYPNCPRATEYSQERERTTTLFSGLTVISSIGVVIAFFIYTFALFSKGNWNDFFTAVLFTVIVAFFDAYIFVLRGNNTEYQLSIILLEESSINKDYYKEQIKTLKKANRKENMEFLKKYFLYFFLGMFLAISIVGIIQGFVFISNGDNTTMLLLSFVAFLLLGCLFFYTLPIGKECFKKIFTKKEISKSDKKQLYSTKEKLFCRKCGTQILPDSVYCDKCGSKVEHL